MNLILRLILPVKLKDMWHISAHNKKEIIFILIS